MKKILAVVLSLTMLLSMGLCFAGCDSDTEDDDVKRYDVSAKVASSDGKREFIFTPDIDELTTSYNFIEDPIDFNVVEISYLDDHYNENLRNHWFYPVYPYDFFKDAYYESAGGQNNRIIPPNEDQSVPPMYKGKYIYTWQAYTLRSNLKPRTFRLIVEVGY